MAKLRQAKYRGNACMMTGIVRLSFPFVLNHETDQNNQDTGKFGTKILIDKDDTQCTDIVDKCIEEAVQRGIATIHEWKGKKPLKFNSPLNDGDEKDLDGYEGHWYLHPKSKRKVKVFDRFGNELTNEEAEEMIYAGANAVLKISFYPYYSNGNAGVAVSLDGLQCLPGGERFGGGGASSDDFEADDYDEDDEIG